MRSPAFFPGLRRRLTDRADREHGNARSVRQASLPVVTRQTSPSRTWPTHSQFRIPSPVAAVGQPYVPSDSLVYP